jgi:hypothetical protein
MRNQQEIFIANSLKSKRVSAGSIDFFIELLAYFKLSDPVTVTTKQLAINYGRTDRSIQRYVRELSKLFPYLNIKVNWDNSNPEKPKRVSNTYRLTEETKELISKAEAYGRRERTVHFKRVTE